MRDARLLVGIGNGRIDQMPDAGSLRSFRGIDSLTGLFFGPGLVAVAHQKHGADATCCLQNRRCVTEIASHEISACRHQLPRSVAIRLAGQRLQCARKGAMSLPGPKPKKFEISRASAIGGRPDFSRAGLYRRLCPRAVLMQLF
jgi:hypothetical protein